MTTTVSAMILHSCEIPPVIMWSLQVILEREMSLHWSISLWRWCSGWNNLIFFFSLLLKLLWLQWPNTKNLPHPLYSISQFVHLNSLNIPCSPSSDVQQLLRHHIRKNHSATFRSMRFFRGKPHKFTLKRYFFFVYKVLKIMHEAMITYILKM